MLPFSGCVDPCTVSPPSQPPPAMDAPLPGLRARAARRHRGPEAAAGDTTSAADEPVRRRPAEDFPASPSSCMALAGRGDELVFFEAALQEQVCRTELALAVMRLGTVIFAALFGLYTLHASAAVVEWAVTVFGPPTAAPLADLCRAMAHHPLLTATRWAGHGAVGAAAAAMTVTCALAKRHSRLREPEEFCAATNTAFLERQFGLRFDCDSGRLLRRRTGEA